MTTELSITYKGVTVTERFKMALPIDERERYIHHIMDVIDKRLPDAPEYQPMVTLHGEALKMRIEKQPVSDMKFYPGLIISASEIREQNEPSKS